ncbi:sirohydrochlorin chelatase [Gemmatimonadota bacterium]
MVILIAHGSRDPAWRRSLEALTEAVNKACESDEVRLAFMQFTGPSLPEIVEEGHGKGIRSFRLLPLFMASAGHVDKDIRPLLEELKPKHPQAEFELMTPVGENPSFPDLLIDIVNHPPRGDE